MSSDRSGEGFKTSLLNYFRVYMYAQALVRNIHVPNQGYQGYQGNRG